MAVKSKYTPFARPTLSFIRRSGLDPTMRPSAILAFAVLRQANEPFESADTGSGTLT
jgi:hypothetical protein